MNDQKTKDIILPLSFFLLTFLTRIPFTSKLLYHWDSVQFALALEKYDITVHQPHPPGYFLYVMLGRIINHFVNDPNTAFVSISILFSGLTVVAIYYLGTEMFDRRTGVFAALIALTSPNVWFHGEVALTYIVEAFFSSFVAILCWRILKGEHKYIWLSVIALGIAGGIRQNTVVFLLPLWLFSVKRVPLRTIIAALVLLGIVCLAWFIPMVWMTGGWTFYTDALRELWEFNTGHLSVFERGWGAFQIYGTSLLRFIIYGLGAGIFIFGIGIYSAIRHQRIHAFEKQKIFFLVLWIMPAFLFYLLIFIHPANPGYVLILLPAFLVLAGAFIKQLTPNFEKVASANIATIIMFLFIAVNSFTFLFTEYPVTYQEIKIHDRNLSTMLKKITTFEPSTTAVFVQPYLFYGYRHIMYYLPAYHVYDVDCRTSPKGKVRNIFWGINKQTFLTKEVEIPRAIHTFVTPILSTASQIETLKSDNSIGLAVEKLQGSDIYLVAGEISILKSIYPRLRISW